MKVTALTASAQLGGTERVLLDFARRASEHGIKLTVITPREGPLVDRLNEMSVPAEVVPAPRALLRGSQQRGKLLGAIPGLAGLLPWSRRLRRHPAWRDADVVYTVGFKAHLAALLDRRHPVVWHLHEFPPATTGAAWRWLAGRQPDGLIANSHATALAWGKGERGRGKGLTVIHNGVDLEQFAPRPRTSWIHDRLGIHRTCRLIGMPAVFARWKGHLEVIEAFKRIAVDLPEVHLVFVGGSIYDTVAETRFGEELRAAAPFPLPRSPFPRIHLLPFQTQIELVYPELDVVLHYSLRPEPFGRVILEAMASGVPVIAAAEGGPLEILGKGEAGRGKGGWLAPARDVAGLSRGLRDVLSLPAVELRAAGAEGRQRAIDHFSAPTLARGVAEVLRSAPRSR